MELKIIKKEKELKFVEMSPDDIASDEDIILSDEDIKMIVQIYEGNINFPKDLNEIAEYVCNLCNIKMSDLKSKCRKTEYVVARQIYCYTAMLTHKYSYESIGYLLHKDHSTVSHAIIVCENCLKYKYSYMYDKLKETLIHFKLFK